MIPYIQSLNRMSFHIKTLSDILLKSPQLLLSPPPTHLIRDTLRFLKTYSTPNLKNQKPPQITKLMRVLSLIFFLDTRYQDIVIDIYEGFVSQLSCLRHLECNNFAAMLYNMKAYVLLEKNSGKEEILGVLNKINQYSQERNNSDLSLVALNQNNMAVLYLNDLEYQKSFTLSLKAYENIKHYLLLLKKTKDPELKNKVVIFVNSCYLIKESLHGRMNSNQIESKDKKEYLEYIEIFHNEGEKAAIKYLGNESYLLRLLRKRQNLEVSENFSKDIVWKHELPVFYLNSTDIAKEKISRMASYLTEKVNPRLDSLLNTILRSQENRKTVIPPPISPPPEPDIPSIHSQQTILLEMTKHFVQTKHLSIRIKIIEGKNHRFGRITLEIIENSKAIARREIEENIVQIVSKQISRDCAPYDTHFQGCSPQQFAEYFILPSVYYQNNEITINPHCKGLFKQLIITFFGFQCLVFVNHIRANEFRIILCPTQLVESFHINVTISDNIMDQLIKDYEDNYIEDPKIQNLLRVCRGEIPIPEPNADKEVIVTETHLTNPELLQEQILPIIQGFQKFILEHKFSPNKLKMLFKHKKKTYRYFKYIIEEFKIGKGCFYGIRNIERNKTIDVVLENRHESYSPVGKIRAKGYHEIEYSLLYIELGVEECTKYEIEEVLEVFAMVSELYHLHTYEYELEKDEKELYGQNAIRVGKLIGRTGKRISTLTDGYVRTVTAQVVAINSEIPLGVKVTIYNTQQTDSNGFFLRLDKRKWLKQKPKNNNASLKQSKMSSNRSSTSIFSNKKVKQEAPALLNFLFTPILTTVGFDILINKLKYYGDREYFGLKETLGNPKFGKLEDFLPIGEVVAQYEEVKKLIEKNNMEEGKSERSPNKLYPTK